MFCFPRYISYPNGIDFIIGNNVGTYVSNVNLFDHYIAKDLDFVFMLYFENKSVTQTTNFWGDI